MATRKFIQSDTGELVEYPVPGIETAIKTLRPGARWDLSNRTFLAFECDDGSGPPTWEELDAEMERECEIYNYYLYERQRAKEYPKIEDQLDMIYHDIDKWRKTIGDIKDKYPKPISDHL
tara:strand:+ start:447 stop:806 length:360 start_codon:yes stop_codon:yes gene_type:complete